MNTYLDLIPENIAKHWDLFNHDTRVNFLFEALKNKLEMDPEYEVWVPFKYSKNNFYNKPDKLYHEFPDLLISNRARIFDTKRNIYLTGTLRKAGYRWVMTEKVAMSFHRAVAYNFVPKPKRHQFKAHSVLEVNHKNGIKDDNLVLNLEWMTEEENKLHAMKNDLLNSPEGVEHPNVIPMLGTVVDIPEFEGYQFIVIGEKQARLLGVSHKTLYRHRNETYGIKTHKGCTWEAVPLEEALKLIAPISDELVEAIKNYKFKRAGKENTGKQKWVYIATNKATGEIKEFIGSNALTEAGFIYPNVIKCITGNRKSHNGYTFEKKLIQ